MDKKLFQKSAINKPFMWVSASAVSILLLALVIAQVDVAQLSSMVENLSWGFLILALIFLTLEGVVTALRLWLFAGKNTCLSEGLKANAWYVLLLVILPARLGEVAAIVVLEKYLGQRYGAGAMSIIAQRLYDVIILGIIFLIALLGLGDFLDTQLLSITALLLIGFSVFLLMRLDMFLTIAAVCLGKKKVGITRKIKRLILQARAYHRYGMSKKDIPFSLLLTVLKWIFNLGALASLFMALHLGLGIFENITVAAAYNFLAIIPLQTIGGIGVGEAGLALLLASMGLTASMAAGASLMIRLVILIFPFIFWVMVMGGLRTKERLGT